MNEQTYVKTNIIFKEHSQLEEPNFTQNVHGEASLYSDTSANEDNSFRNHIRLPKRDFPQVSIENRLIRSGCCPLFKDTFYKIVKSTL